MSDKDEMNDSEFFESVAIKCGFNDGSAFGAVLVDNIIGTCNDIERLRALAKAAISIGNLNKNKNAALRQKLEQANSIMREIAALLGCEESSVIVSIIHLKDALRQSAALVANGGKQE